MPPKEFDLKDTPLPTDMEGVSTDIPDAAIDYTDIRDILGKSKSERINTMVNSCINRRPLSQKSIYRFIIP